MQVLLTGQATSPCLLLLNGIATGVEVVMPGDLSQLGVMESALVVMLLSPGLVDGLRAHSLFGHLLTSMFHETSLIRAQ